MKVSGVTIVTPSKVSHHIDIALFVSSWDVTQARPAAISISSRERRERLHKEREREREREGERGRENY